MKKAKREKKKAKRRIRAFSPPTTWFEDPLLTDPVARVKVTPEGRVFGSLTSAWMVASPRDLIGAMTGLEKDRVARIDLGTPFAEAVGILTGTPGGAFVPGIELSAADILTLLSAFEEVLCLDTPPAVSRVLVTATRDGLRVGDLRDLLDLILAGKKPCPACAGEGYVPSPDPGNPEEDDADGSLIPCEACDATGAVRR